MSPAGMDGQVAVKVHLNCGTMNTPGARMVCHVLLVETDHALVLVDTGFGSQAAEIPAASVRSAMLFGRCFSRAKRRSVRSRNSDSNSPMCAISC